MAVNIPPTRAAAQTLPKPARPRRPGLVGLRPGTALTALPLLSIKILARRTDLSEEQKRKVLGENAARVFRV